MATAQKIRTRLFFSYTAHGKMMRGKMVIDQAAPISDAEMRALERRLDEMLDRVANTNFIPLRPGEPRTFIYDFQPIEG